MDQGQPESCSWGQNRSEFYQHYVLFLSVNMTDHLVLVLVLLQVVLFGSETQASLYLADLVQGTYLFQLKVTDAQARSSTATATVEVRPGGPTVLVPSGSEGFTGPHRSVSL